MGSSVRRKGQRLQVWKGSEKISDLRLFDLERLVVVGPVDFSTQALALLLDRGIDVSFLTTRGRLRGSLVSGQSRNVYLRLAQFDRWRDADFRIAFGREVVRGKLTCQRRIMIRYERNHPGQLEPDAPDRIQELVDRLPEMTSAEELMGLEGAAASVYYRQFGRMLTTVSFPGRKRRPPPDPANALLSFGYVILTNEIAALLEAQGFDPAIGYLHGLRYGRNSLALDVIEAFRQPLIDRLTLRLLNRRQLGPDDFEGGEGGVRLLPDSLKLYLQLYEEQMRSPSEGKESPTWRQRLDGQAAALKEMVMAGTVAPLYAWEE
jgi:CRISPR-associated protein Cas1